MNRYVLSFAILLLIFVKPLFATPPTEEAAPTEKETVKVFSEAALLGMQLSIKQGSKSGNVPNAVASCVAGLKPDSFFSVYDTLLGNELTATERHIAEKFFASPVGRKYAKHGLLQIYGAAGENAPEGPPAFSQTEMKKVEEFRKTTVSEKLNVKKVLQKPEATRAVNAQITQLLGQCERVK